MVARMVIEIRSDGQRTVARGVLEHTGPDAAMHTAVEARGTSPAALASDLLRSLIRLPIQSMLAQQTQQAAQALVERVRLRLVSGLDSLRRR